MNKFAKTTVITATALVIGSTALVASADWDDFGKRCDGHRGKHSMMMDRFGGPGGPDRFMDRDLDLSANEAKTLVQARLIMRGNERLKVGEVSQKDEETYLVDIVTVDDSLVRQIEVDKDSGLPSGRFGKKK